METTPKVTGHFSSFDGTSIYYEIRGEGEPLILVYGIACLMNHWHHQIEFFSKKYQVITFDLRGHQKSNPVVNLSELTMDSLSQDLLGLMDHLKIKKAHAMGHSFGVPILINSYRLQPERFKSFTFINGFAKNPIKGMFGLDVVEPFYRFVRQQYKTQPDLWNSLWKVAIDNPMSMTIAALAGGFNLRLTQFKDIEVYMRGVARLNLQVFLDLFESLMNYDGEVTLPDIKIPTLVLSGERDMVTPLKFQTHMKDLIPDSEFVLVPYGSHCTQLDFPEYTNLKLEKFLEEKS